VVHIGDKIQVEIREVDDRGKLSLVPVEVVEREAAGEDLSGGESRGDRGDRPRESRGDRGDRGDRGGDRGGDRDGDRGGDRDGDGAHRRTRHRSRGHHE
jgi:polyribonucleotide nucleotidyltransferase